MDCDNLGIFALSLLVVLVTSLSGTNDGSFVLCSFPIVIGRRVIGIDIISLLLLLSLSSCCCW